MGNLTDLPLNTNFNSGLAEGTKNTFITSADN